MANLVSPGVSITVEDQSFYAAAGTGTVPLIVVATAQDKVRPDGTGLAGYTTKATAGAVKLITSQRDLISNYGNPIFKTSAGTSLHGHELNEYGLQAAYSFLGIANRAYILRADIDMASLEARTSAPTTTPEAGAYWLDSAATRWGIKEWSGSAWVAKTVKVPTVTQIDTGALPAPKAAFGIDGEYAVVYWDEDGNTLAEVRLYHKVAGSWFHIGSDDWLTATLNNNTFSIMPHTALVNGVNAGDVMLQTTSPNNGTSISAKVFNLTQFVSSPVAGFEFSAQAFTYYDQNGGVDAGDLWADFDSTVATVVLKRHNGNGPTVAQGNIEIVDNSLPISLHYDAINDVALTSFEIIVNDSTDITGPAELIAVTLYGFDGDADGNAGADDVVAAINSAISTAPVDSMATDLEVTNNNGKVRIVSRTGYEVVVRGGDVPGFTAINLGMQDSVAYTNWETLSYEAKATEINGELPDGTLWYDSLVNSTNIDIMYNNAGSWETYPGTVTVGTGAPTIVSEGDIWVDSSDLENYPQVYKRVGGQWVGLDETDQVSSDGILFADFRSSKTTGLLDADAPQASLYPYNMLAWNKRLSGGNVKQWDASAGVWVDFSGNREDGAPRMLRKAQRSAIVKSMQAAVAANTEIRNESNRFNLIACPGYPELMDEMVSLNIDRKETAFIVGDAPFRLRPDASSLQAWSNNENNATENGEDGLTIGDYEYAAVYYPHGLTTGLDGQNIVVPSSHIALRTLAYNDQVAFPWFAPAGFQRGIVSNATSVGYIDADSAEYVPVSLSEGQRDTLYVNRMNPIGNFPGRGLAVFGQKTLQGTASALDRVNVARLTVYIRERLDDIVKPFLFEPNDEITRQNAKLTVDRFLSNLVTQRGLFDFVTVCDTSNNTPERIDRNELHIDIAIQPIKAVEFIYIPIRVQNTLAS